MNQQDYSKPALIGGLTVGALSVIPLINSANTCCCLWAWVGGVVTAKLVIDGSPRRVTTGDAAKVGLYAGLLGAFIRVFIGLPVELVTLPTQLQWLEEFANKSNNVRLQEFVKPVLEQMQGRGMGQQILALLPSTLIGAVILMGVTVLGAMLGVALFEKRKDQPPPSQYPPDYPPPSGGYGGEQGGWPQS